MSRSNQSKSHPIDGTNVLDDAKALGEKVTGLVGPAAALTQTDIKRSTKLRKGGETIIPMVAAISDQLGLVVPSFPTNAMVEKIDHAKSLVALHKQLVAVTKQVSDAHFLLCSESWAAATVHYSVLRRLAEVDGKIAKMLLPVQQFFSKRSALVEKAEKEKRGGARKGSAKAKSNRAASKAAASQEAPSKDSTLQTNGGTR